MNYLNNIKDIHNYWHSDKKIWISSLIIPTLINIILAFTCNINNILFVSMMNYLLTILVLWLPFFMNKIKNDECMSKYKGWNNSWKLSYWIPLYFFMYSVVISMIGMCLLIAICAIYSTRDNSEWIGFYTYINSIDFVSWIESIFYIGYSAILAISISFLINSFVRNKNHILIMSSLIYIFNFFFIGNIPLSPYLDEISFKVIRYFGIYSYTSINGWISFNNGGAFMFEENFLNYINHLEKLMNFTIPFILISISIGLSSHYFRWFKGIENNKNDDKSSISKIIINIAWISISLIITIIGIVFLIIINHSNEISIQNWKYILGTCFVIAGIINTSLSAGYLVKNLYINIYNKKLMKKSN